MTKPGARIKPCFYLRIYKSARGGCVDAHMYLSGHDRDENIKAAIILADKGYKVQLLPDLYACEVELRQNLLPDVFGTKNPDARINGIWIADFKKPSAYNPIRKATISRLISSAPQQKAEIAIINLSYRDYTILEIKKGIIEALQPGRNRCIMQVWIITQQKNLFFLTGEAYMKITDILNCMMYKTNTAITSKVIAVPRGFEPE